MKQRGTGVFGTVQNETVSSSINYLQIVPENDPDTIYNLLFEEFDEEKVYEQYDQRNGVQLQNRY